MEKQVATHKLLIFLFMGSFLIPAHLNVGGLTLGFTRLFLLVLVIPSCLKIVMDKTFKWTSVDILMICFSFWVCLALFVNHGTTRIQFIGLTFVETFGAYAFGRAFLARYQNQIMFWRLFALASAIILPFGLYEMFTSTPILYELVKPYLTPFPDVSAHYPPRLGLHRVAGNFEHPILFGVFWAHGFALVALAFQRVFAKIFFTAVCLMMVFISLSSGAWLMVMFQAGLLFWGLATKGSWKVLLGLVIALFIVAEIASDRSAIVAISSRLAFSAHTAYARVNIWNFGILNVWANPFFGLGLNDWVRPDWLGPSVDNNWLLMAIRYGLPAIFFFFLAMLLSLRLLIKRTDFPAPIATYRTRYVIVLITTFFALGTVAVWSGTQSFLYVFLAMGVGLSTSPSTVSSTSGQEEKLPGVPSGFARYTRFPNSRDAFSVSRSATPAAREERTKSPRGDIERSRTFHTNRSRFT